MNYPPVPYPSILQEKSERRSDSTPTSVDLLARTSIASSEDTSLVSSASPDNISIALSPGLHDQITASSNRYLSNGTCSTRVQRVTAHPDLQYKNNHETPQDVTLSFLQLDSQVIPLAPPAPILSSSELSVLHITENSESSPPSSVCSSPRTPFETIQNIKYPTIYNPDPDLGPITRMHDGEDGLIRAEKHVSDSTPATPPVEKRQKVTSHKSSKIASTRLTPAANSASQYQKLSQPFRSPLINSKGSKQRVHSKPASLKPMVQLTVPPSPTDASASSQVSLESVSSIPSRLNAVQDAMSPFASKSMSKPFKSPLLSRASGKSTAVSVSCNSSGLEKRKIQELEKRANMLRQAKRLRLAGVTERVEEDMKKWRNAARDAAEELWSISQSNTMNGMLGSPCLGDVSTHGRAEEEDDVLQEFKNGFEKGWGWATGRPEEDGDGEQPKDEGFENDLENWEPPSPSSLIRGLASRGSKMGHVDRDLGAPSAKAYSYSYGKDKETEEEEPEPQEWNIGGMLVSLGIDAKGSLGWDDEEGGFADDN